MDKTKGAKCEDCQGYMLEAKGCNKAYMKMKGKWYKRDLGFWQDTGDRCHDCGAISGNIHHFGCDVERCPKCKNQLLSCECWDENTAFGNLKTNK